ncbi:MAG: GDP-mannose 4,6-dehydratase [Planctomycetes bacterium]|nr:GDP-mannose 4,6-dehydratase [Planctomycetota bacterium]
MVRYLITGGAGFIGSHLAERLLHHRGQVHVIDDLSTGAIRNIEHLKSLKGFGYTIDDIRNAPVLAELVDGADVVVHLAAAVGVQLIVESPVRTIETNVAGTEAVLTAAAKKRKKVIIASTSEVYGKSAQVPFRETSDLVLGATTYGRWSYACSKAIDEFLALAYWREKKLPVVIVRLFNTVGPRQVGHYGMVVPRFVKQALAGGPITVYGDGKQTRCFCDVADVVEAVERLAGEDRAVGEIFNIGSGEEVSVEDLARRVAAKVDPRIPLKYVPYDEAYAVGFEDMRRRVPDVSKVRALIGWTPRTPLDQILDRVIEYHRAEG